MDLERRLTNIKKTITVDLKIDEKGFTGRECPRCKSYFKVKKTDIHPLTNHFCPYCGFRSDFGGFLTKDQTKYVRSIAMKEVLVPLFKKLQKSLKTGPGGGLIQLKWKSPALPIRRADYSEKDLETEVICDSCGLEFCVYGVFAHCPNCSKFNAKSIFTESMAGLQKWLDLAKNEPDLEEDALKYCLTATVAAFDGLGNAIIKKDPMIFKKARRNLFQRIHELDDHLLKKLGKDIDNLMSDSVFDFLFKMFQVRHLYEHNAGVIDDKFVRKFPSLAAKQNQKYALTVDEISLFTRHMDTLGKKICNELL